MTFLPLVSDFLLLGATAAVALWCRALARRPDTAAAAGADLQSAIAAMKAELSDLRASMAAMKRGDGEEAARLKAEIDRADDRIGKMEMLLGSLEAIEEDLGARGGLPADGAAQAPVMPSFRDMRAAQIGGDAA